MILKVKADMLTIFCPLGIVLGYVSLLHDLPGPSREPYIHTSPVFMFPRGFPSPAAGLLSSSHLF